MADQKPKPKVVSLHSSQPFIKQSLVLDWKSANCYFLPILSNKTFLLRTVKTSNGSTRNHDLIGIEERKGALCVVCYYQNIVVVQGKQTLAANWKGTVT